MPAQLALRVITIDQQYLPGVLVHVVGALGHHMALAGLKGGLDYPHAVLLPAHQIGVEKARLDQLVAARRRGTVVVVGHQQFLLAHQLEVVAVGRAEDHKGLVEEADAGGDEVRGVVGNVRRAAHPALADQILPGGACTRVHVPVGHQAFTGLGRWLLGEQLADQVLAAIGLQTAFLEVVRVLVPEARAGGLQLLATGGHQPGVEGHVESIGTLPGQAVVPQHLGTVLRYRKGNAAVSAANFFGGLFEGGAGGVLQGVVVHPLRRRGATPGRIDIQAVVRVLLQQRLGALGQLLGVLRHVARADREQRLVGGERVGALVAALVTRRRLGIAAGPFRDTAVGVAGALAAQGREVGIESRGLVRGDRRLRQADTQQGNGQGRNTQGRFALHGE